MINNTPTEGSGYPPSPENERTWARPPTTGPLSCKAALCLYTQDKSRKDGGLFAADHGKADASEILLRLKFRNVSQIHANQNQQGFHMKPIWKMKKCFTKISLLFISLFHVFDGFHVLCFNLIHECATELFC